MQELDALGEALVLMRRALELIDGCSDPYEVGPHLDLAIARMSGDPANIPKNDNFDDRNGRLIY